jgi:CheY-like chemotaxis protein
MERIGGTLRPLILYRKKVFIIEDNATNLVIAKRLLENEGALVSFERWGKHTIEKLKEFSPVDIILLDLMFPNNVTGYDLFDQIREVVEFKTVPIVAVSASYPAETIPKVKEKGFCAFIAKPIEYEEFAGQVARILGGEEVWINR